MKIRTLAIAAALVLGVVGAYVSSIPNASGQAASQWATEVGCTTETIPCTAGSCTRETPDAGADAGVLMDGVKSYTVRVCGTTARPLAGAGSLKDYDCVPGSSLCSEVVGNIQSVTSTAVCQETPAFVVPAGLPTHRMVWAASGVTISNADGGAADVVTVTVCPAM